MAIAIYSLGAGTGKSTLAAKLSKKFNLDLISLDHQDNGCIENASKADDNSILDCPPYQEFALAALKHSDQMIYMLKSQVDDRDLLHYLKSVLEELTIFKGSNENLNVYIEFDNNHAWTETNKEIANQLLMPIDFVHEYKHLTNIESIR